MTHLRTIGVALALASGVVGSAALAQTTTSASTSAAASAATGPSRAASKPARRIVRRRATVPVGDPAIVGATGGSPEASSRTPAGPPPGMKTGITFPLPSIGGDGKK